MDPLGRPKAQDIPSFDVVETDPVLKTERAPKLNEPDADLVEQARTGSGASGVAKVQKRSTVASAVFGFLKPAVAAVIIAATPMAMVHGAPLEDNHFQDIAVQFKRKDDDNEFPLEIPIEVPDQVVHELPQEAMQAVEAAQAGVNRADGGDELSAENVPRFNDAMRKLNDMRKRGEITTDQYSKARATLYDALIRGTGTLAEDHRGRIDFDALIYADVQEDSGPMTRGQIVLERLSVQLESRMRITARDMTNPNLERIEGAPGYKVISEQEVKRLVVSALKDIPIGELPGGDSLADIISGFPGGENAKDKSFNELEDSLGDAGEAWLKEKFGPFLEEHKIEAAVIGFASVTGLRYASPEAAQLMDKLDPRITIWRGKTEDGRLNSRARLAWRDAQVFPQLDLESRAVTTAGPFQLRAQLDTTFTFEGEKPLTGAFELGAHLGDYERWIDGSVRVNDDQQLRFNLNAGQITHNDLTINADLTANFGDGTAIGDAAGRARFELDLAKDLKFNGAEGSFGFYTGVGIDTDGRNEDVEAGIAFRLRW